MWRTRVLLCEGSVTRRHGCNSTPPPGLAESKRSGTGGLEKSREKQKRPVQAEKKRDCVKRTAPFVLCGFGRPWDGRFRLEQIRKESFSAAVLVDEVDLAFAGDFGGLGDACGAVRLDDGTFDDAEQLLFHGSLGGDC